MVESLPAGHGMGMEIVLVGVVFSVDEAKICGYLESIFSKVMLKARTETHIVECVWIHTVIVLQEIARDGGVLDVG